MKHMGWQGCNHTHTHTQRHTLTYTHSSYTLSCVSNFQITFYPTLPEPTRSPLWNSVHLHIRTINPEIVLRRKSGQTRHLPTPALRAEWSLTGHGIAWQGRARPMIMLASEECCTGKVWAQTAHLERVREGPPSLFSFLVSSSINGEKTSKTEESSRC